MKTAQEILQEQFNEVNGIQIDEQFTSREKLAMLAAMSEYAEQIIDEIGKEARDEGYMQELDILNFKDKLI